MVAPNPFEGIAIGFRLAKSRLDIFGPSRDLDTVGEAMNSFLAEECARSFNHLVSASH